MEKSSTSSSKIIFEREIAQCKKLSKENGGKCAWGKCKDCGVVPLLYKLYKGVLIENSEKIEETKRKIFFE